VLFIIIKLYFHFFTVKSWNIQNPCAECNTKINSGMNIECLKEFVECFGGNWHSKYSQQKIHLQNIYMSITILIKWEVLN